MAQYETYKTAPLECVRKAGEIRKKLYQDVIDARQSGKIHIQAGTGVPPALFAPYDILNTCGANYGTFVARQPELAADATAACASLGYSREMCAYFRNSAGTMFLNKYAYGGEYAKPDAVMNWIMCPAMGRWYQVEADHFGGLPFFGYETPYGMQKLEDRVEYLAAQFMDAIEWLEKVTGKPYDDEKFIHALDNMYYCEKAWAEISLLQGSVPVPVPLAALLSLMSVPFVMRQEDWCRQFMDEARDEIKYRVENQIAAAPVERCRLATDTIPPWNALDIFKYTEKHYGAIWTGIWIYHVTDSLFEELEDGTLIVGRTPAERGVFPKNREEAAHLLAQTELERQVMKAWCIGRERDRSLITYAKQMKADAVALHMNRGCQVLSLCVMQNKRALQQAGIPAIGFEGNHGDPTDTDPVAVKAAFDGLMGVLGVKPLYGNNSPARSSLPKADGDPSQWPAL